MVQHQVKLSNILGSTKPVTLITKWSCSDSPLETLLRNLRTTPLLYSKYLQASLNTSESNRTHKKTKKKRKKIERNETHAMKWNKWSRGNMYYEATPFIVFICNKKRVHEIFLKSKLQIMYLKTSISIFNLSKICTNQECTEPGFWLYLAKLCSRDKHRTTA